MQIAEIKNKSQVKMSDFVEKNWISTKKKNGKPQHKGIPQRLQHSVLDFQITSFLRISASYCCCENV